MSQTNQTFIRKISWFTVVGIVAAIVYVAFSVFLEKMMGLDAQLATGCSVLISALVSYFGHYYLTFLVSGKHSVHAVRFTIQIIITIILNGLFIKLTHQLFGIPLWFATSIFAVLMPIVNFIVYQIYTFRKQHPTD